VRYGDRHATDPLDGGGNESASCDLYAERVFWPERAKVTGLGGRRKRRLIGGEDVVTEISRAKIRD
jgi:hypothetical protein